MEENQNQSPALFGTGGLSVSGDAAAVARATQEIQAALVVAQRFPRDEVKAEARIMQACQRKGLAEVAEYEYSRGGTRITGPTIDLLRAVANRWGNLQFGWEEVERANGQSSVRCFAWDLQSNGKAFRTFVVKHWRDTQSGGYALKDERDIYELLANMAARRVRACLEEVIDADIVEKAIDQCRKTLREGEKTPLKDRAVKMVTAFAEHGVTQAMIEARLGNKLEAVSENQLASLRRIYKSLQDGVGRREDYFKADAVGPDMSAGAPGTGDDAPPGAEVPPSSQTPPQAPLAHGTPRRRVKSDAAPATPADPLPPAAAPQDPPPPPAPVQPKAHGPVNGGFNALKALRMLCRENKVAEGELLGLLADFGSTDGSVGSLEELQMSFPQVLKMAVDQWSELLPQLQTRKD